MLNNAKEDCFAFITNPTGKTKCSVLITKSCKNCRFYKTKEQYEKDVAEAEQHNKKVGARNYEMERVEKVREAAARQYERKKARRKTNDLL